MKIAVLVPSHEQNPAMFTQSLAQLCAFTAGAMPDGSEFGVTACIGTYSHKARQELMEYALESGADYALWLDSDMTFPQELFALLFDRDVPMVGINYSTRKAGGDYVAIEKCKPAKRLVTDSTTEGIQEVEAIGFGAVLMRMRDFQGLNDLPKPWFQNRWDEEEQQFIGEDVHFCRLVREKLNMRIFADHDVSKHCGHVGTFSFTLDHLEAVRKA